ncbi:MAG: M20 family metallo-hydrolase [Lachnospiraceae bacterium]
MLLAVNRERLNSNIQELAKFGLNQNGGIDRSIGSRADLKAREWLTDYCKNLNADVYTDAIANIHAVIPGKENLKKLVIGSHHDAVPNGGKYDGAMGVLLGIEVMQILQETGMKLRHPYEVLMFTAEEPNPFSISTMGSRSITGKLTAKILLEARDCNNGMMLSEAIKKAGGDIGQLEASQMSGREMSAFIECHIEQSRNLDDAGLSVATVTAITGIYREVVTVHGEANHAGTTPMNFRHDALTAASCCVLAIEKVARDFNRTDIVATVGKLSVKPDSANIIPDTVSFIMEIRTSDQKDKNEFLRSISERFSEIEEERGVFIQREINLNQDGVVMDDLIGNVLTEESLKVQEKPVSLVSMAGHDAVHMTSFTRTGMLFVRSIGGKSHCVEEYSRIEDIEAAGNVLLSTILRLDRILDAE